MTDATSAIAGFKATFPTGSLTAAENITVTYKDSAADPTPGPAGSVSASPLITLTRDQAGAVFNSPVFLTIPFKPASGRVPLIWTRPNASQPWRLMYSSVIDSANGRVAVDTRHFSDFRATYSPYYDAVREAIQQPTSAVTLDADSGFTTAADGFFVNNESVYNTSFVQASCLGLAAFATAYYENTLPQSGKHLASMFRQRVLDNAPADDSPVDDFTAVELTSRARNAAQTEVDLAARQNIFQQRNNDFKSPSDENVALVIALLKMGKPVLLVLRNSVKDKSHAVVIYKYVGDNRSGSFYVYDPNFPSWNEGQALATPIFPWSSYSGFGPYSINAYYGFDQYFFDLDSSVFQQESGVPASYTDLLSGAIKGYNGSASVCDPASCDKKSVMGRVSGGLIQLLDATTGQMYVASIGSNLHLDQTKMDGPKFDVTKLDNPMIYFVTKSYNRDPNNLVGYPVTISDSGSITLPKIPVPGIQRGNNDALVLLKGGLFDCAICTKPRVGYVAWGYLNIDYQAPVTTDFRDVPGIPSSVAEAASAPLSGTASQNTLVTGGVTISASNDAFNFIPSSSGSLRYFLQIIGGLTGSDSSFTISASDGGIFNFASISLIAPSNPTVTSFGAKITAYRADGGVVSFSPTLNLGSTGLPPGSPGSSATFIVPPGFTSLKSVVITHSPDAGRATPLISDLTLTR